jgi:diacylglycerol kinase (ATP)
MKCAFSGVLTMLKYEHNAWIHALATLVVCSAGFYFRLSKYEWCLIIIAILMVWAAEALNTALEFLADVAVPDFHPTIEKAKDVAAGAVLIASIGSVVIGILILGPYILNSLRH